MTLTQNQIIFYQENGYLIIDELFDNSEIEALQDEAKVFEELKELPNIVLEENGDVRSVFAPHKLNPKFDALYKEERILKPAKQLVGEELYLFQYKLNNKKAFVGDWWEWHQDFPFWYHEDGIPEPKLISVMILMQDTNSIQGPLIVVPGSHKNGLVEFEPKPKYDPNSPDASDLRSSLSADLKYTVNRKVVKEFIDKNGFVEISGKAGTCCFFHPNLFHASNSNISPYVRNTAIITYNDMSNIPAERAFERPDYISSKEYVLI